MKVPKPKVITVTKAKKDAWAAFSKFIRARDCFLTTGTLTMGKCISCGKIMPFKKLQGGHFLPGRTNDILLDEEEVHAQCGQCNIYKKGNWVPYRRAMILMFGLTKVEEMEARGRKTVERGVVEWQEQEQKYLRLYNLIISSGKFPPEG